MISILKAFLIAAIFSMLSCVTFATETGSECPSVNAKEKIFDSSLLIRNSRISIENGDEHSPVVLSLYRPTSKGCDREMFAKYSVEGSMPTVTSLFFLRLSGEMNVFTIITWTLNNRGAGTFGTLFQIYAYRLNEGKTLIENIKVVNNAAMTGIDGYDSGQPSIFKYKTAADVKRFWMNNK